MTRGALPHGTVRPAPAQPLVHGGLRVTGRLTEDARLHRTTGQPPHLLLDLTLQPPVGLPYLARVDLGTDVLDHMDAEGLLPLLRTGCWASVAGDSLELRTDHGHAALRVVRPHTVLALGRPVTAEPAPDQSPDQPLAA